MKIAQKFASAPTSNIPQACGDWPQAKAAYRFCSNQAVEAKEILRGHQVATVGRMREHEVILAIQDTTSLNFSSHPQTKGLGPIGNNRDKTIGLLLHSVLAINEQGLALGLLSAEASARDPEVFASECTRRKCRPIREKESYKWFAAYERTCEAARELPPERHIVSVCDREADIYELFDHVLKAGATRQNGARVSLLVRARQERQVSEEESGLWEGFCRRPAAGAMVLEVPAKAGKKGRQATLSVRFSKVSIKAPSNRRKKLQVRRELTVWAIEASEEHPPKNAEPLCWRLITTLEVENLNQALEKLRWYALRWQIEVFHKILKSGCAVEDRQLESAEGLKRALMIDLVVAWRVLALSRMGRDTPGVPASVVLAEHEWKALYAYIKKTGIAPGQEPELGEAMKWIGRLGGFLARKRDGYPGPEALWLGLQRLADIAETWLIFNPANCG